MKAARLFFLCLVIVALSACSGPLQNFRFEYAESPPRAADIQPQPAAFRQDGDGRPSAKGSAPEPAPDIDAADESLEEDDGSTISDLAVRQGGEVPAGEETGLAVYEHYIAKNEARYLSFIEAFPELPVTTALALVNVNADYGYYSGVSVIGRPESLLVLCNKNFQLPAGYVPESMRGADGTSYKLHYEAASAFERMKMAMREELGLPLVILSAYRDYAYQDALYKRYAAADGAAMADTYSARAGHSEHQTGLAVDFMHKSPSGTLRAAGFQNTAQYAWLQAHAHEYGFILRYPEGSEPITGYRFEPWHWRFIGAEDAARMFEAGIATFEEYIGTYYSTSMPV